MNIENFVPFYQPIFNSAGEVYAKEVLARYKSGGVFLAPSYFLEILMGQTEEHIAFTLQILNQAFSQTKNDVIASHVNLSYFDLYDERVRDVLKNAPNNHRNIVIEILEIQDIKEFPKAIKIINELKEEGFIIAIDDFGTGFHDMDAVNIIQPTIVKIDKSILKNGCQISEKQWSLLKEKSIELIFEGVETEYDYMNAKKYNPDGYQGFLLGKPQLLNSFNKK